MSATELVPILMATVVAAPLLGFALVSAAELLRRDPLSEMQVARIVLAAATLALASSLGLGAALLLAPGDELVFVAGSWFSIDHYDFVARLTVDSLSVVMLSLSSLLVLVGARFSVTYMHRDLGFRRFFGMVALFQAGLNLLMQAGSIDLLFVGWEIVGLTSTFLIAFFHEREAPVAAGLRAFVTYRCCDIGLLVGAVLLHHYAHTAEFDEAFGPSHWPMGTAHLDVGAATVLSLLFLVAAMGKAGAFPVGGWLPRAMEGPTPSSALFYGGLSVAAGTYLLLRVAPLFAEAPIARLVLGSVGALTFLHATLVGRVQTDAKNQLAYASITQTGLIFVWIALDLRSLAILHLFGHISLRTYQLFRAPSLLHDLHRLHGAMGGEHLHTGRHLDKLFPARLRRSLYAMALQRFGADQILERLVIGPVLWTGRAAARVEQRITQTLLGAGRRDHRRHRAELEDEDLA